MRIAPVAALLALAGCTSAPEPEPETEASCAAILEFQGRSYAGFGELLRTPKPGRELDEGVLPGCDDQANEPAEPNEPVVVLEFPGVDVADAVLTEDGVWVAESAASLPRRVAASNQPVRCVGDGPRTVAGSWDAVSAGSPSEDDELSPPYVAVIRADEGPRLPLREWRSVTLNVLVTAETAGADAAGLADSALRGSDRVELDVHCEGRRFVADSIRIAPGEPDESGSAAPDPEPPTRAVRPGDLDPRIAVRTVGHLAGEIGPRHATSAAYRHAAAWVEKRFTASGYDVTRQPFDVPAGNSWGVDVPAGRAVNLIAAPPDFDPARPHLIVGAHLDTVPPAPGAEDNASGVGVMLAVAEAVAGRRTRLPVVFIAFGAEEPRGPSDDDHHYGSRAYVASLTPAQRRALRAMVALDRVGVGSQVPVGSAADSDPVQRALLAAAERARVPTIAVPGSRSSDHWSFVRDGLPGARLGSTSYAAYHSPDDVPSVVEAAQLERTGRIVLAWLAPRR